jgi:membrane-associated protein
VTASLTEYLLAYVLNYGAPFLGLALLIGAIGIPIPTTLLVIAGGAFIRQGFLDLPTVAVLSLVAAVTGDSLCYGIGGIAGGWVERRYGATSGWRSARQSFLKYGPWSIYLSRFLLTSIAIPVNLIAGSTSFGYRRFLPLVLVGEITWLVGFGCLGYAFGSQWEAISDFASNFGGLLLGLVILAGGIYLAIRLLRPKRSQTAVPAELPDSLRVK